LHYDKQLQMKPQKLNFDLKNRIIIIKKKQAPTAGQERAPSMQWHDTRPQPKNPPGELKHPLAAVPPDDEAGRLTKLGDDLLRCGKHGEAAAAFERAETLGGFRQFANFAFCYLALGRPDAALAVCDRGLAGAPGDSSDLQRLRGDALALLERKAEARDAYRRAVAASDYAYTAAESLLLPLVPCPDGARLLAACDELPTAYSNCTVVRGFRAIALSRLGRTEEAKRLVDPDRHVGQFGFEPPTEFGGIERFNALLAEEIVRNPALHYVEAYGFHRTEHLDIREARAFPALSVFLQEVIENFIAEFARRGLDLILPPAPAEGYLKTAGNVVRGKESHHSHLHKFAYVSGVYHVTAPGHRNGTNSGAGALVIGACEDFTGGYAPCWGRRDIRPKPGVATVFPSHIFHSVVPTGSSQLRIAVPFDLGIVIPRPATKPASKGAGQGG
jgi:tetratricopeptide (TPR) repeat protein